MTTTRIGLGCMGMSAHYGPIDDQQSLRTLHRALELGVTHFDTSASYGDGHNETLVGQGLKSDRDRIVLATKFGIRRDTGRMTIDSTPQWARQSCEDSLRRLDTDVIDLFYLHRRDPATPIEETVEAMAGLVAAGKVRRLGLSEVSAETIRRAHAVHPIAALQVEYSLFSRHIEAELLPLCRLLGIEVVAYSPVGRGLLTGAVSAETAFADGDLRAANPRFTEGHRVPNLKLVDALMSIGKAAGCMPAQAALAWVLAQGKDITPIPGTKRVAYLEENLGAQKVELTAEQIAQLDGLASQVSGERLAPQAASLVGH